jgi:hypothetical protein
MQEPRPVRPLAPAARSVQAARPEVAVRALTKADAEAEDAPVLTVTRSLAELGRTAAFEDRALAARPECMRDRAPECLRIVSDAIYGALAAKIEPAILTEGSDASALVALGAERVHGAVGRLLLRSADPIERVVALALLDRLSQLQPLALPDEVYRGLADLPVVESQLLLRHHVVAALPPSAIPEALALVSSRDVDPRVQGAALEALGHPPSADALQAAVEQLGSLHDARWDGWVERVAPALGRCGLACAATSERLLAGPEPDVDLAIAILRLTPSAERDVLWEQLEPMFSQAELVRVRGELDL